MSYTCPVCGWPELSEPPYDEFGSASFEICPCCGVEFGYDDEVKGETHQQARARWIADGMKWWSTSRPAPEGWNASLQLARIS